MLKKFEKAFEVAAWVIAAGIIVFAFMMPPDSLDAIEKDSKVVSQKASSSFFGN